MDLMHFSIEKALTVLRQGGVILYPTDTVWGIGCDATNPRAIERIYRLKQRAGTKSMIILVAREQDLLKYTAGPHPQVFDYLKKTDRPTTVIYESALGLPENLVNADGTIAIRVVRDDFCRTLIKRLRAPLVSTSANLSGTPAPNIFSEIQPELIEGVDYVVDYRQDDRTRAAPSRIIRILTDGTIQVIRK